MTRVALCRRAQRRTPSISYSFTMAAAARSISRFRVGVARHISVASACARRWTAWSFTPLVQSDVWLDRIHFVFFGVSAR